MSDEQIEGAFDGPRQLIHEGDTTRWPVTAARARDERAARARLAGHPLATVPVDGDETTLVFPRLGRLAIADGAEACLAARAPIARLEVTPRTLFAMLGGPVDAARALGRVGLPRARVDRFLDRPRVLVTGRGIDLGGVMPGALRTARAMPTAISLRHGRAEGWPVIDLASLALRGGLDVQPLHAAMGGDDEALALAMLHQALRERATVREEAERASLDERIAALLERFVPVEPERVRLSVEAPDFLDRALFAPLGEVTSAHARRLLRDWDGLAVGGDVVRVHTEPRLARPARSRPFEPMRVRRARLFSRFDEGIRYDDEGLFSATPEALADRIASGLRGVIVDATCGIGAIALALARSAEVRRVVAIDRDEARLRMAAHNAGVYGVRHRIELRAGDALAITRGLDYDAIVLDPPWGGRDYDRTRVGLDDLGLDLRPFFADARPIVLKLPRSFDVATLPPGFAIEALVDGRGVLKMLVARRGVASEPRR